MKRNKNQNVEKLVEAVVQGLLEKKGKNIITLDLRGTGNSVSDFFVICHGTSDTQVLALASSVEDEVRKSAKEKPWHVEGTQNAQWVLIDYVDVVAHIFLGDQREFYRLEDLWADAKTKRIEESFN